MKKNLSKNLKQKLVLAVIVLLALLFFTNDFGFVDVSRAAIVVAAGVDKTEEGYVLTCQVERTNDVQSESGTQTSLTGKGATLPEAVFQLQATTGLSPKLYFCKLLILGETMIKENFLEVLHYFFEQDAIPNNVTVASVQQTAAAFLAQKAPLDNLSAFTISRILAKDTKHLNEVFPVRLFDIALRHYEQSNCILLPFITVQSLEDETKSFQAGQTCVLSNGTWNMTLNNRQTQLLRFITDPSVLGLYRTSDASLSVQLYKKQIETNVSVVNGSIQYQITCSLKVRRVGDNDVNNKDVSKSVMRYQLTPEQREHLKTDITQAMEQLILVSQTQEADLFDIGTTLYKWHFQDYQNLMKRLDKHYLLTLQSNVHVEITE